MNPAPFFAFVNAGNHQIVSTSPERFLLRNGSRIETRPIKGTRPRGRRRENSVEMKSALTHSHKDDAELSMIVDLLRNDIGKVCAGGSVVVALHKRLETYQNVYHLVSVVEGTLAEGKDSVDLIRATFPGGSITGCPKTPSARRRSLGTGLFFPWGAALLDSDPEDEFEETLHKGRTLMSVFRDAAEGPATETGSDQWVWLDGRLIHQARAAVPVSDLGLQYGFGFFETIRVEKGEFPAACRPT